MFEETKINDIIKGYLATPIKLREFIGSTVLSQKTNIPKITISSSRAMIAISTEKEIRNSTPAQKRAACSIKAAKTKIKELEQVYNFTSNSQLQFKALEEQQEVVWYDKCSRPSYLLRNSDLLKHIYNSIKYGSADTQRRKEAIKVRIVNHLRENLKKNYGIYMARTTLNNYLLPHHSNLLIAKAHYHSTWVAMAGVSHDKTKYHLDGHYCLASVKGVRQFVQTFADLSVIISQDNKTKIGLGVAAVSRIFYILQSSSQSVQLPDYNFVHRRQSKYNPVEKEIATLSGKLAEVVLLIDYFRKHLDSQSRVVDNELATKNFHYAGSMLCDIWDRNPIFEKYVKAIYIDKITNPFQNFDDEEEQDFNESTNTSVS
ncbi:6917_t:CDS:2 [Cetraspora pellucida]|uniref:6917_t:CDS:1 n=1 Tax=Cetraspora pellucida TaxID=1433469 RepID=A0A9N9HWC8_9GLOM|nr:6917_t:CDS:2 [Cetraspora pellucida]